MTRRAGFIHNEETRKKIKSGVIIARLEKHILAETPIMDASQVNAARVLLNKVLPDLKALEHTGEDGGPIKVIINKDGRGKSAE